MKVEKSKYSFSYTFKKLNTLAFPSKAITILSRQNYVRQRICSHTLRGRYCTGKKYTD